MPASLSATPDCMLPSVRKAGEQDSLITITCEVYPTIISGTNNGPLWDWRGDGYSGADNKAFKVFCYLWELHVG
jgi:hypothetical protein